MYRRAFLSITVTALSAAILLPAKALAESSETQTNTQKEATDTVESPETQTSTKKKPTDSVKKKDKPKKHHRKKSKKHGHKEKPVVTKQIEPPAIQAN
ncbi:hypothetical protein [Sphaerospermopsis sp. LEGE 08334]|uniref:hypothetical protein n=1 Tax=Sphaerospermopsis sp. LEGE 08334 TaxID=1828651 RepID=UPI001882C046|nr:hypothetical protein [Sphaerospermopsis sp. LEGE 08334]MBE9055009.1 hypothetical protein [Sphaerospermopsis sp. LEGE 08334]